MQSLAQREGGMGRTVTHLSAADWASDGGASGAWPRLLCRAEDTMPLRPAADAGGPGKGDCERSRLSLLFLRLHRTGQNSKSAFWEIRLPGMGPLHGIYHKCRR